MNPILSPAVCNSPAFLLACISPPPSESGGRWVLQELLSFHVPCVALENLTCFHLLYSAAIPPQWLRQR